MSKTSVVVFSLMLISLFSCVSGGDLGGMVQGLREADQANNPKDETGNYIARINDPNIRFTPGGNFFSTMHIMDGDGISKIEFKQVPASVYVMSENNLLRYPKEGGAASPQDAVWQIVNPGMMGPATYRITVNSQAAANDLDTNTLVLIVTDTKNKSQELVITFTKKN